jgi:tRNA (guanosine-2'-O-)-methyltransferase
MKTPERTAKLEKALIKRQPTLTIVLENVHDPHNVSAVVRSCDAVGVLEVHLLYYGGQEFPKLGERSSASARKWLDFRRHTSVQECFQALRAEGKKIFTTHMNSDSVSLYDLSLAEPVALVFGNEKDGVSEEALSLADGNFLIPQVGMIQSLNISVACAVSLFECYRQRQQAGMYHNPQMSSEQYQHYLHDWLQR